MRPLEGLLNVANVGTFLLLVIPLRGPARRLRYWALVALPVMGVQLVLEGPRWQMIPAYVLGVLLILAWLVRDIGPGRARPGRTWARRLVAALGVVLGVLGLALSVAPPIVVPVFSFPHPTGPYDVGTVTRHWVDAARPEVFTADPDDRRELMAQIWYPTHGNPAKRAPWVQDADALAPALARQLHMPGFAFGHFKYVTSNAITSAPVATDEPSYPVLIFLHGFAGFRQHNTFQVEELVSHGYIVAAIDQPYAAASTVFPDGRQVVGLSRDEMSPLVRASYSPAEAAPILNGQPFQQGIVSYLAKDVSFTLDQLGTLNQADPDHILTGRLDLKHVGVFGPSLGGIVGAEACRLESRLRACLVMDAPMPTDVVQAGLRKPTMWITRDADTMRREGWPQSEIDEHQKSMRAVFDSLPRDAYFVQVRGMFHLNLTDFPLVTPLLPAMGVTGPIDAHRAHSIINSYSLAFFDQHLKAQPATLLDGQPGKYPEVVFEAR